MLLAPDTYRYLARQAKTVAQIVPYDWQLMAVSGHSRKESIFFLSGRYTQPLRFRRYPKRKALRTLIRVWKDEIKRELQRGLIRKVLAE
ncbi:MAG: hypothetical protein ABFS45_04185 [Pseudomonadota bacterium]